MNFIDTHCHLYWKDFSEDLPDVLARSRQAGVRRCIIPATDMKTYAQARDIAAAHAGVYTAVGVHPHDVKDLPEETYARIREHASEPGVVAVGEIGLDYYYDFCPKPQQHAALHRQLEIARETGLPVILHNRESDDDLLSIVLEHQDGSLAGQFHCFSSSVEYAEKVLEAGFHVSFTGNVTFKKSTLDEILAMIPDDRLLIETDSPFMTPVPHRGKRNDPSNIPLIAERFASTRGQSIEHVAAITTRNAELLFRLEATNTEETSGHE